MLTHSISECTQSGKWERWLLDHVTAFSWTKTESPILAEYFPCGQNVSDGLDHLQRNGLQSINLHVNVLYITHSHIHQFIYVNYIHCIDTCTCMYKHWFFFQLSFRQRHEISLNFTCLCHTHCPRDAISSFRAVKVKERSPFSKAWITKTGQEIDISDVCCQLGIKKKKKLWYKRILIYISGNFFDTKKAFCRGKKSCWYIRTLIFKPTCISHTLGK